MPVLCKHWSDCGLTGGGCCAIGEARGRPTLSYCARFCVKRAPTDPGAEVSKTPTPPPRRRWTTAMRDAWIAAGDMIRALTSGRLDMGEPEEARIVHLRVRSCHGDESRPPCEARRYSERRSFHYCGDCMCGDKGIARLSERGSTAARPLIDFASTKLTFRRLPCPRQRPGFANAPQESVP